MRKLKIFLSFFLLLTVVVSNAQNAGTAATKKKKKGTLIKAHRGTVVFNLHDKVSKQAQTLYAGLPKMGAIITALPANSAVVIKDSISYYYKNGFYYLKNPKGFQIVLPSVGVSIHGLPIGYRRVPVGDKAYFYYYGTFYSQVGGSDSYEVVMAPDGAIVDALPDGYKIEKVDNVEYYLLGDTYYAEVDSTKMESKVGYEVGYHHPGLRSILRILHAETQGTPRNTLLKAFLCATPRDYLFILFENVSFFI